MGRVVIQHLVIDCPDVRAGLEHLAHSWDYLYETAWCPGTAVRHCLACTLGVHEPHRRPLLYRCNCPCQPPPS